MILLCLAALPGGAVKSATMLLRPHAVWNGEDATHVGWVVLLDGGRIAAVGPADQVKAPADAKILALPDLTLLPGLIDLHSHVFLHPYNETAWNDQVLKETLPYRTLAAAQHAQTTLLAGFTALRDLGTEGAGNADLSVKRAIDDGMIPGPHLFIATRAIVATGTYGPPRRNFTDLADIPQGAQEVSGIDEAIRATREQIAAGADWVKLYADYRWGPGGALEPTLTEAEIRAITETAHGSGRKVAVHAASDEGMRRSAMAGVDTIEHGYNGSAETFALMAKKGIAFLPTLTAEEAISQYTQGYVPGQSEPTAGMRQAAQAFALARKAGVTIACGSDVGVFSHGTNAREILWLAKLGMSPTEALQAATSVAARILDRQDDFGRLKAGLRADIIGVADDPNKRLETILHVSFVMKDGVVYRQP